LGWVLLWVIAAAAVLLVSSAAVVPNIITAGTREKEEEMIWRGKQYARAVKLYFRKFGRFPTSLDELTKKQSNIRFMRRPYKDPMNREDGKWRLIYVLPNGQLVGSVTRTNVLLQIPAPTQPPGQRPQGGIPGSVPGGAPQAGTQTGGSNVTRGTTTSLSPDGTLIGGNIIGVASKVNQRSIRVYGGGQTYREWEFIWDPTAEATAAGAARVVVAPGTGRPGLPPPPPPPPPRPR
jgi:type II secretory pathway pseudopilin PulG